MIQKNVRSLKASERIEELVREVEGCKWDALLKSGHYFLEIRIHELSYRIQNSETVPQVLCLFLLLPTVIYSVCGIFLLPTAQGITCATESFFQGS